jgi:hypothetical protein
MRVYSAVWKHCVWKLVTLTIHPEGGWIGLDLRMGEIAVVRYRLDDRGSIPGRGKEGISSLRHRVQTGSGAHPPSYPMGTGGLLPLG